MNKKYGVILIAFMSMVPLFAQLSSPRLLAKEAGAEKAMFLRSLAVEVQILGYLAETRLTMTFYNPHGRVLEGELVFPLPEGATVSGYALDVNGTMVDGVVVEREKGQRVFETVVRRGVDPGLVEWVKGNNFRTRIYPLRPHGTRTVMVRYLTELAVSRDSLAYCLPLGFPEKVNEFFLKIVSRQAGIAPRVVDGGPLDLRFERSRTAFVAESRVLDADLSRDLRLELPRVACPQVLVEKAGDGWHYFCVLDELTLGPPGKRGFEIPTRIAILWDASGSRGRADRRSEIALLREYFRQFDSRSIAVDLVEFRHALAPARFIEVVDGDTRVLEKALEDVVYDGGTQLGCLPGPAPSRRPAFYLLFSDGISSIGREDPGAFPAPVYAVASDPAANHTLLRRIAESSGGEYLNLNQTDPAVAAARIGAPRRMMERAEFDSTRVDQPFPTGPQPAAGSMILAARLMGREAAVTFHYRLGKNQFHSMEYRIVRETAEEGDLLRTYWAQRKIQELSAYPKRNKAELVATGKEYGLVSPGTSLIVLERLDQYLEFGIEPPSTFGGMRDTFARETARRKATREEGQNRRLSWLIQHWNERVTWWDKDIPPIVSVSQETSTAEVTAQPPQPPVPDAIGGGSIRGIVKDQTGGVIPGVSVTLSAVGGRGRQRVTGDEGEFSFLSLPTGTYKLQAQLEGFKTFESIPISVENGGAQVIPVIMDVGEISREVLVSAEVPFIETATTSVNSQTERTDSPAWIGDEPVSDSGLSYIAGACIDIRPWAPDLPYVRALKAAAPAAMFGVYLEQKGDFGNFPGFYLDCSDLFFEREMKGPGIQVLTNLAELRLADAGLLRVLGHRLAQIGEGALAIGIFREAADLRPEEPQSWRDLALAHARRKEYAQALDLLNRVIMGDWGRFEEIALPALMEANALVPLAKAAGVKEIPLAPELVRLLDTDLRIVLTWDSDVTDIDLWVTEPGGERVCYKHNRSTAGGMISKDFTEGYGPEEYLIRHAVPGAYKIEADYYETHSQQLLAPVTLRVDIFTNFGRPAERCRSITRLLPRHKDTLIVGEVTF